jgi:hypothetical protein
VSGASVMAQLVSDAYDKGYGAGYVAGLHVMDTELRDKIEALTQQLSMHLGPGYEISIGYDLAKLIAAVPDRLREERENGWQDGMEQSEGAW